MCKRYAGRLDLRPTKPLKSESIGVMVNCIKVRQLYWHSSYVETVTQDGYIKRRSTRPKNDFCDHRFK